MTTTRDKTPQTVYLFAEAHHDSVIREWLIINYSKLDLQSFAHEFKKGLSIEEIIGAYQAEVNQMNNRAEWSKPENNKLHVLEDWGKKSLLQQMIKFSISMHSFSGSQLQALNTFTSLDINDFTYDDYKENLLKCDRNNKIKSEVSRCINVSDKINLSQILLRIKEEEPRLNAKRLFLTFLQSLRESKSITNFSVDIPASVEALEQSSALERENLLIKLSPEREAFFAKNILEILSQTTGNLAFLCGFAHAIPVAKILLKAGVKVCICYNANPQQDLLEKETTLAKKILVVIKKVYPDLASEVPLTSQMTIEEFNQIAKPSNPNSNVLFATDPIQAESSGKFEMKDTPRPK